MPGRRLLVALLVLPFPACLHLNAPTPGPEDAKKTAAPAKPEPAPPRFEFASLPRIPGTVFLTRPGTSTSATQNPHPPVDLDPHQATGPVYQTAGGTEPGAFPVVAATPAPEPPLLAVVRAYLDGRSDRAIELLRALDKPNQDLVLALLPVLTTGAAADLNRDPATVATLVDQLHGIAARLEPRAALRIEKATFCTDVKGFGRYTPRPPDRPYKPNEQAEFYLEVHNLTSEPTRDGYLTHAHATVEIRDAHQKLVEQTDPESLHRRVPSIRYERQLASRSPLHDFHMLYAFPAPVAPGVYTITLELRDAAGGRSIKTAPVQFCVAMP